MGVTSIMSGDSSIAGLARQLFDACDSNRDGKLTSVEFQDMLQHFVAKKPLVNRVLTQSSVNPGVPPALEGFNMEKLASRQSPKYQFARAAMQHSLADVRDKPSAQALLERMRPTFEAQGLDVLDIQNDRIKIRHEGQEQWIDVIRATGSANQAFQWMVV